MILSGGAYPTDYYGSHRENLKSFGGYAPNMPLSAAIPTTGRRPRMETSVNKMDYTPHCLPSPEQSACRNAFLGRSGFSVGKALHLPSKLDVLRAHRAQSSNFYSHNSRLSPDSCLIPGHLQTETKERFQGNSKLLEPCGATNYTTTHYWIESPGSRDSGFSNGHSNVNPVYWRQLDPLMDQMGKNPQEIRTNAASVSHTEYRPHPLASYESAPIQGIMKTRLTKGTGFTTDKELHPCFLPEPCVYGHHTASYLGDPSRYDTTYNSEFQARCLSVDTNGCTIIGKGPGLKTTTNDESPDFSLGCGPPRDFLSETRQSFPNNWPLEGMRNFGLSYPVGKLSNSGFVYSIKNHRQRVKPCEYKDTYDTTPQRYNPWPKFYLGHRTMIDKGYRPNPEITGIDYAVTTSLPTTGNNADVFLY